MDISKIFKYAAANEAAFEKYWNGLGHERKTTFFSDLSIAECYGADGIRDTYDRVMKSWMDNLAFITEFIVCLGLKSSQWCDRKHGQTFCNLYSDLYHEAVDAFYKHYEGNEDALDYFFEMTD